MDDSTRQVGERPRDWITNIKKENGGERQPLQPD